MDAVPAQREFMLWSWDNAPPAFYAGTAAHPIYVDCVRPTERVPGKPPVVMVHGGGHTGACYLATPDLRPGWAPRFAAAGRSVFVPDWPGHGRSPMGPDFARLGTQDVASALLGLLERVGPAVLLVHSASGPMAWWMVEQRPDLVAAVVAIAPGPPANLLADLPDDPAAILKLRDDARAGYPVYSGEDSPVWFGAEFAAAYWANAPRFPSQAFENYRRSIVPESARILNERFNIGGRGLRISDPSSLKEHRILIVTGDHDARHPREVDEATAKYLGAEFVWLPERGIRGNGHMMMIEDNSDDLAAMVLGWLDANNC
ncbi:alpha/beta fold hydrolase [Bradyrhizobium sp. JYMT SZCCT0428]|uniref:alpha/beta fold hydrolase n=1 Tax=Bradyrhizobium sp. JYMT SZCCT0428 TaxID=2807673 RepID=UPI001BA53C7B|nr:alpha/beta fold hydrolase [Bradyrhizobium sp. JYMT SZCCT0428]MBR1154940.1 alpha/beta fold hydrolase [Bradyrhizobium sp. JYMT SZCCT0428]